MIVSQNSTNQVFKLDWNDNSTVQLSKGKTIVLPLVEGNFFDEHKIPSFSHVFDLQNKAIVAEYQIINVKYSLLPKSSLKDIDIEFIPKEIQSEFQISQIKDKSVGVISLIPLINDKGQIKKITSFDLNYSLNFNASLNTLQKSSAAFVTNSVLATGTWYKFKVDTTGIFKIDKELQIERNKT